MKGLKAAVMEMQADNGYTDEAGADAALAAATAGGAGPHDGEPAPSAAELAEADAWCMAATEQDLNTVCAGCLEDVHPDGTPGPWFTDMAGYWVQPPAAVHKVADWLFNNM